LGTSGRIGPSVFVECVCDRGIALEHAAIVGHEHGQIAAAVVVEGKLSERIEVCGHVDLGVDTGQASQCLPRERWLGPMPTAR